MGPFSLIHAMIKKFGHNMSLTANDHAAELIDVDASWRIFILTNAAQSRKDKMVDDRMQYHMGAVFLTKKSRNTINAPAPIGALGSYLFNSQKSLRSPVAL
jgi:hypothetical protein